MAVLLGAPVMKLDTTNYDREVWFLAANNEISVPHLRVGESLFVNPLLVPRYVPAEFWKEIVAKMFCEAHNLEERRFHNLLASQIDVVYREHHVYDKNTSFVGNMLYVYDKFHQRYRKTNYPPALKEAILFQALLDPLCNPEIKKAFCASKPNDDEEIVWSRRRRTVVLGQKHLESYNTWLYLLLLNKLFEYRRRKGSDKPLLVGIEKKLLTKQSWKTLEFIGARAKEANMVIRVEKDPLVVLQSVETQQPEILANAMN